MSDESDDELKRNRGPSMAPGLQYPKFEQYDDWEPDVFPPNEVSDAFIEHPELRRSLSSDDLMTEDNALKENGEVNPSKLDHKQQRYTDCRNQNLNQYFYYDSPLLEETGAWIPISIPPMPKGDLEEWQKSLYMEGLEGDYLPEGDRGWDQCIEQDNEEMTMWEVFRDMLIMAREKISSHASIDFHGYIGPWVSKHMLSEVWEEMAQTLKDANFGNIKVILEAEPPRWLPDSAASSCMLCNLRFHPIMRSRHHCRFCGGIFCNGCSKGRMLLPATFHTSNLQRVCDVCNVRLEPIQTFLIDQISRAVQLPTHDLTDLSTLRSWLNFPWSQSMEYEIYKATNTLRGCDKVGYMNPDKSIPSAILKQAKGLAILTVAKVGAMFTYNIGTGIVVARRDDKSWSPPSAISSFGFGWGAQIGGEVTDFIIVLRTQSAVRTFSGKGHISVGAGLSAAVGISGRAAEAGLRVGDGGCAPCYTYSFSKGAFVGCSLEGSMVTTRTRENSRFYGDPSITASNILLGSMPRPPAAAILYYALSDLYKKIENS